MHFKVLLQYSVLTPVFWETFLSLSLTQRERESHLFSVWIFKRDGGCDLVCSGIPPPDLTAGFTDLYQL